MDITMEIAKSLISQGPLVGLLFWLHIQNNAKLDARDKVIAELNKEMRDFQEKSLNKQNDLLVNITAAVNGLKEALRNA